MIGPNTGFRDNSGADALRNLTNVGSMRIANRSFTTAGAFKVRDRLSLYGGAQVNFTGALSIDGGFFELTPRNAYRLFADDRYPLNPEVMKLSANAKASFDLRAPAQFRVRFFDSATAPTLNVGGSAKLAGMLAPLLLPGATVNSTTRWTILTAKQVVGKFSNVASGQRISVFSGEGSFLVTMTKTAVILSDFQTAQ